MLYLSFLPSVSTSKSSVWTENSLKKYCFVQAIFSCIVLDYIKCFSWVDISSDTQGLRMSLFWELCGSLGLESTLHACKVSILIAVLSVFCATLFSTAEKGVMRIVDHLRKDQGKETWIWQTIIKVAIIRMFQHIYFQTIYFCRNFMIIYKNLWKVNWNILDSYCSVQKKTFKNFQIKCIYRKFSMFMFREV